MGPYVLGIDCGNTGIKVALFDLEGHEVAALGDKVPSDFSEPGFVQCNMVALWQQCGRLIHQLLTHLKVKPDQVIAVGCSGHGNGLYLLDNDRQPLLAIKSLDCRANELTQSLKLQPNYNAIHEMNRQGIWPAQSAALLIWLKQYDSPLYQNIGQILFCKDYLNFCLTGEVATEYGDLSASGLYDFSVDEVSDALLSELDLLDIKQAIPKVYESQQVMGRVSNEAAVLTGLSAGTPVVSGCFDIVACAIGSGVWQSQSASVIAGSWSVNQVVTQSLPSRDIFMACHFPEQRYLAIESSATSASNLEWFICEFFKQEKCLAEKENNDIFQYLNRLVADTEVTKDLPLFHPYLYGGCDNQPVQGNFFGLAGWHKKSDLLYAVYEGIVFGHLEHVSQLRMAGQHIESVVLSGGAARSQVWSQMFADILNVNIQTSDCTQAGARGAAMAAATGAGYFTTLQVAVNNMAKLNPPLIPNSDKREVFLTRYQRYLAVSAALKSLS